MTMIRELLEKIWPWPVVRELKEKNKELENEVQKRQEAINKTNAYWKKRFYDNKKRK